MGPANCRLVDRGGRFPSHSGSRSGSPRAEFLARVGLRVMA
jgi:hypothetical protein